MGSRITSKTLEHMADLVNTMQGLPRESHRHVGGGDQPLRYVANAGHIGISAHSPGDGWTRYRVVRMTAEGGEEELSPGMTATEAWHYLRGVMDALEGRFGSRGRLWATPEGREILLQAIDRWILDIQEFDNQPEGDEAQERIAMLKDVRQRVMGGEQS